MMPVHESTSAPRSGACEKDEEQLEREELIIKPPPETGVIGRREQYSSPADRILGSNTNERRAGHGRDQVNQFGCEAMTSAQARRSSAMRSAARVLMRSATANAL